MRATSPTTHPAPRPGPQASVPAVRWVLLGLVLLALVACERLRGQAPEAAQPGPFVAVSDSLGRTVRLPAPALKVLSLSPAATEVVFALQRGEALVGRTESCDFPPEAAAVPSVGSLFPPDLERLLSLGADLVIMMDGQLELRAAFEARGVPVFVHQPKTVAATIADIGPLGTLLDAGREAHVLQRRMRKTLARLPIPPLPSAPSPPPSPSNSVHSGHFPEKTGLYVVWGQPLTSVGGGTFLADVLRHAGLRNLTDSFAEPWPKVPLERVVALDPQVVVVGGAVDLSGPGWASLPAVRAGRVIRPANTDLLVRPGPRLPEGIAVLAAAVRDLPAPGPAAGPVSAPASAP